MNKAEIIKLRHRGLSVFPVSNDTKIPLVYWRRLQTELPTYEEVNTWFSVNNRSVGVATGRCSGILLLDLDFKHPEARAWWSENRRRLPRTWMETTKSGGLHLYFKWIAALEEKQTNTTARFARGVDTKGQGGYSKIAPSTGYKWVNSPYTTPLSNPPQWLVSALPDRGYLIKKPLTKENKSVNWMTSAIENLQAGNRNETFTKLAGSLRSRGYDSGVIFELLKGKAIETNFSLAELQTICSSIGRYEVALNEQRADDIEVFLQNVQNVSWIVRSIFARQSISFLAGLPETGKTWASIDLAIECARGGGLWLGRFPCEAARVLFIDQERFKGETQRRFRAVIAAKGIEPSALKERLFIKCGTTTRINLESSYRAFRQELEETRPDLVVVDSFATFHTVEENNRGEIQTVLERIKALRTEFGCAFVFIDHENKGAYHAEDLKEAPNAFRLAGSVAKPGAVECILTVRKNKLGESVVYHTKSTLATSVAPFPIRLVDEAPDKIKVETY